MVEEHAGSEWTFVIDTDEYAGNFERDMCAYLTGQIGECEVGREFAELARKELTKDILELFDEYVISVPDEHGCNRPCTIWKNPNWWNDGMGNHWRGDDKNFDKQVVAYVKSYEEIYGDYMKNPQRVLKDLEAGKEVQGWTKADVKRTIARHQKKIDDAKKVKKLRHHPAYNSVGIWFDAKPTPAMIELMKERAAKFAETKRNIGEEWDKKFKLTIEGFRLVQNIHNTKESAV